MGITKPCTHLHPAPSTTTQLISTSIQLHPPPPNSLQHLQQYLNQNIARNWAISPNLGRKIKSCLFWRKISTHGIMEVLIPNPDLDFWNSHSRNHFWGNLSPKIQSCPFCLKIRALSISRFLIPNFKILTPKSIFGQIWVQKFKDVPYVLKLVHIVS